MVERPSKTGASFNIDKQLFTEESTMKRSTKIIKSVCVGLLAALIILSTLFILDWNGAFNKLRAKDVASFESPDGKYTLIFQQLGHPQWPFGETEVRLTLKGQKGNKLNSVDTEIQDDGANASEVNIQSTEWTNDSVIIILQASEMPDKTVELKYKK